MLKKSHTITNMSSLLFIASGISAIYSNIPSSHETIGKGLTFLTSFHPQPLLNIAAGAALFMAGISLPDIDQKIPFMEHRTYTHSIWMILLLSIGSYFYPPLSMLTLSVFLHLFWDSFSTCGVAWFYPFSKYNSYPGGGRVKKGHHIKLYRTGSPDESIIVTVFLILAVMFFIFCMYKGYFGYIIRGMNLRNLISF